jgi:transcription factor SFP1
MNTPAVDITLAGPVDDDVAMGNGSLRSAAFHPASYTRQFWGSPISWRAGSFGSRFYPACSPGQLLDPLS